jgi:hypothetical protein
VRVDGVLVAVGDRLECGSVVVDELPAVTGGAYVYDIETACGRFAAGVGDIVVKNTDSVFIAFDCKHPDGTKMAGIDAVHESWRLLEEASKAVSERLPRPQSLAPEASQHLNINMLLHK